MCGDFNRIIIQLSQHPVVNKSFSDLTCTECEQAYVLINELISLSVEEDYTLLDYIQMARLKYYLGELSCKIYSVKEDAALHYGSALHLLNLSACVWRNKSSLHFNSAFPDVCLPHFFLHILD